MDLELAHIHPQHQRQAFASRICTVCKIGGEGTCDEESLRVVQDRLPAKERVQIVESAEH